MHLRRPTQPQLVGAPWTYIDRTTDGSSARTVRRTTTRSAPRGQARGMATAPATLPAPAIASRRRLRRDIGVVGLLFTSVGSIIGSGWLFGALTASKIAGPAALLSWVIGGGAMILLALVHAELGGMYP